MKENSNKEKSKCCGAEMSIDETTPMMYRECSKCGLPFEPAEENSKLNKQEEVKCSHEDVLSSKRLLGYCPKCEDASDLKGSPKQEENCEVCHTSQDTKEEYIYDGYKYHKKALQDTKGNIGIGITNPKSDIHIKCECGKEYKYNFPQDSTPLPEEAQVFNPTNPEHLAGFPKYMKKLKEKLGLEAQPLSWEEFDMLPLKVRLENGREYTDTLNQHLSEYNYQIIKSFIETQIQKAKEEVEHCDVKECPECNLKAYNKGKEEARLAEQNRIRKIIEGTEAVGVFNPEWTKGYNRALQDLLTHLESNG